MYGLWLILGLLGLLLAESRGVLPITTGRAAFFGNIRLQSQSVQRRQECAAPDHDAVDNSRHLFLTLRGGDQEQLTLDQKVQAAMKKLGLKIDPDDGDNNNSNNTTEAKNDNAVENEQCEGGVCPMPPAGDDLSSTESSPETPTLSSAAIIQEEDLPTLAQKIADSMNVHSSLAMAALGATAVDGDDAVNKKPRTYNEQAARAMVQQELDIIANVPEDSTQVQQLVSEGFDSFLSRRALAFADMEMDDARAILIADQEDEQQENERKEQQQLEQTRNDDDDKQVFKSVKVDSSFDPTKLSTTSPEPPTPPSKAKKADVVFEATAAQVQELVLESPVPVLVDIYADWCGPCKVLGPILEEMAVKSGGLFRLVKINSDNERPVSSALEVTALPTVFGIRDGRIIHMFQGMPQSEEAMKNFMMGVIMPGGEANFAPALTSQQKKKYTELTTKLVKMAGSACFSFSARERLQDRIATMLETLVEQTGGDPSIAEESALVVRSFISNVIRDPIEPKFRKVNLNNAVVEAKIVQYPAAIAMLTAVGFHSSSSTNGDAFMILGKGKKMVNIAPLTVARDSIDQWIDKSRYDIARAARKRKDEQDRSRLEAEGAFDKNDDDDDDEEEEEKEVINLNVCKLKLRMDGKKKVQDVELGADESLHTILQHLPVKVAAAADGDEEEVRITCVAKRLVVKSSDKIMMNKSFRELGLSPAASIVVKVGTADDDAAAAALSNNDATPTSSKLVQRVTSKRKKKKGSHTMQSVGIYSKDDNAKGELVDGGGGTLYEQDVSDDEEEEPEKEPDSTTNSTPDDDEADSSTTEIGQDEQDDDDIDVEGDDK